MPEPVYLSSQELDEIAEKLEGSDDSLDTVVADEYGIDDYEIPRITEDQHYEFDEKTKRWVREDPAKYNWPWANVEPGRGEGPANG